MAIELEYPTVNEDGSSSPRQTATVLRNLVDGKNNGKGEFILQAGKQTTVYDQRCTSESVIANIALTQVGGNVSAFWFETFDGYFIVHYGNTSGGTLFRYAIIG